MFRALLVLAGLALIAAGVVYVIATRLSDGAALLFFLTGFGCLAGDLYIEHRTEAR